MKFKTFAILCLVAAPFVFAYYQKPLINAHKEKIYQIATESQEPVKEDILAAPEWDGLEFVDWVFVTATKDKTKQSMVTFGIVRYIKVMDKEWATGVFGLKKDDKK